MSILFCLSLVGCGNGTTAKVFPDRFGKIKKNNPDSFVASENERYALNWDSENKRVVFTDKQKNILWSYVPFEAMETKYDADGYEIIKHPQILSPINITVFNKSKQTSDVIIGQNGCVKSNTFSVSKIKNGISITYYFEKEQISVPVDYVLRDGSLSVRINPKKITEGEKYMLTSVSVAPFFCSVPNKTDDTYLFIPSGSGTLSYADEEKNDVINISDEMYGIGSRVPDESAIKTITANLTMPVYGAKNGNRSVLAIIEGASESTAIHINSGSKNIGYSSVYAEFEVRSHTTLYKNENWGSVSKFSSELTTNTFSLGFYPLYDDDSDYVGMAEKYREYLLKNGMKKSREEERMVNLEILGGTKATVSVLGVPYDVIYPTTTVNQSKKMVSEISKLTGQNLIVQMCGFGESGLDIGKIAGNFTVNKKLGSKSELKDFSSYCKKNGISLYFDYDALQYKESSSVASVKNDSALAVNNRNIRLNYYYSWCGTVDSTGKGWNNSSNFTLIKRSLIPTILDKIIKSSDKYSINGISLSTLGRIAYSDNSEQKYYSKGQIPMQISSEINRVKKKGKKVLLSSANAYAAMSADYVLDAPSKSSQYDFCDEDVPFYQIVFKGTIPLATQPIAMSGDTDNAILNAVETGTGLTFALSNDYTNDIIGNSDVRYFGSNYSNAKKIIKSATLKNKDYYKAIKGAKIINHGTVAEDVKKTEYDNGIVVYVNYSDKSFNTPFGIVNAKSYIYADGGEQ